MGRGQAPRIGAPGRRLPLALCWCYAGGAMDTRAVLTHPLLQRMLAAMLAPLLAVAGVLFVLRLLGMI
jgi:hypothetical protein